MFAHIASVCYDQSNKEQDESVFANELRCCRNMERLIDRMMKNYDESQSISLEMHGFCKVFDIMYQMDKEHIAENNIELAVYHLAQMEEIMWRCIDKMKDLNIFFPEPDLLKPFLYIKDLELECRSH